MERRYEARKEEILEECKVPSGLFAGIRERLRRFVQPFADRLRHSTQRAHVQTYVAGLTSDLERKNAESIAYLHDQERKTIQHFVGESQWDERLLQEELAQQVSRELGKPNGVIVFDPSGFPKHGTHSVGVARQWCGRLGKVDNCQVAVYMGYVSILGHTLVDERLYLPKSWAKDRKRRKGCGVPTGVKYRTRHDLALEMLAGQADVLPHQWIAGDEEMGRSTRFRHELTAIGEHYLLAVPSNTVIRDLEGPRPEYQGVGARPKRDFEQVRHWIKGLSAAKWSRVDIRDGEKGPLIVEVSKRRVEAKMQGCRVGPEETLVVIRTKDEWGINNYDYYLSNAPIDTSVEEFARVANAEHRIEECIKRAKSEGGLADYEVRTWIGWHHHQVLSMIATWFLAEEAKREKKSGTRDDGSSGARCHRAHPAPRTIAIHPRGDCSEQRAALEAQRAG